MSSNNTNSSQKNTQVDSFSFEKKENDFSHPPATLRRQTTNGECYYCGDCPENKEIEYRCWSCNKFATPLAASAMWKAFQRKGTGWPNGPNNWWIERPCTPYMSWYVWTRRWNNLPKSNLSPYWAQKLRLKKMKDFIDIW